MEIQKMVKNHFFDHNFFSTCAKRFGSFMEVVPRNFLRPNTILTFSHNFTPRRYKKWSKNHFFDHNFFSTCIKQFHSFMEVVPHNFLRRNTILTFPPNFTAWRYKKWSKITFLTITFFLLVQNDLVASWKLFPVIFCVRILY